ncbi:MAG: CpsD/CapB family tyrosine-protein kinase [Anaerolineae bacterium]
MQLEEIVTLTDPHSPAAEAYRSLRVNLRYASLDTPLRTLVVASPTALKGAAKDVEVAVNLAVVTAQAGEHVALVDADLRHPTLHALFGEESVPGLPQAILTLEDEAAALPLAETGVENLRLLPGGHPPPNPVDILSSQKMSTLLERLTQAVDVVILKAPPVLLAADTPALAARADGLLLVTRSGHTRRDHLVAAKDELARFDVRLLGAVLTDAPHKSPLMAY